MLMTDLLEGSDGNKMSKTYDNCIYLTDVPDTMFEKIMRVKDALIPRYFKLATTVDDAEVIELERAQMAGENPLVLKRRLAGAIVTQYHGVGQADQADRRWQAKFLDHQPEVIHLGDVPPGVYAVIDLLVAAKVASSRSQGRRQVQQGGVRVNGAKWSDPEGKIRLGGGQHEEVVLRFGSRLWGKVRVKQPTI
jgi:tyrosyl-tRNA synthetase